MSEEQSLSSTSHHIPLEADQRPGKINKDQDHPPQIPFVCHLCDMHQICDYYGNHPPFAPTNKFSEDCFIKKDPFEPHPGSSKPSAEYLLVLGANCDRCGQPTCRSPNCSVYYRKTVCLMCAQLVIKEYPIEIQTKIKKKIQN